VINKKDIEQEIKDELEAESREDFDNRNEGNPILENAKAVASEAAEAEAKPVSKFYHLGRPYTAKKAWHEVSVFQDNRVRYKVIRTTAREAIKAADELVAVLNNVLEDDIPHERIAPFNSVVLCRNESRFLDAGNRNAVQVRFTKRVVISRTGRPMADDEKIVSPYPHEDGDYSYQCTVSTCKCQR